jgi:RNA polymerase sigma-70 factor (ECF subfamily)
MLSADHENEFFTFYQKTALALSRLASRLWSGQHADAEDSLQRAYVKALQHWPILVAKPDGKRYSWMVTTLINEAKQQWRAPHRSRETGSDVGIDRAPDASAHRSLDDTLIVLDRYREACRAIIGLGGRTSEIMILHCIEGYEIAEIAERLEIAPATVRVHLSKGRERLRTLMTGRGEATHG